MSELDNTEALNSIANSLEEIAYAMKAPASSGGGLSTFQEICSQLSEIDKTLHKNQANTGHLHDAVDRVGSRLIEITAVLEIIIKAIKMK